MTSENSVPFKAILVQNDAEPEIRRFSVSKDVVTNFVYVKQKLMLIFPSLKNNPFIICWKDHEGDQVQIWSDEELIIALTEMEGDSKKLYVFPSQNYSAQSTADNRAIKTENSMGRAFDQIFKLAVQMFICFISALQHFLEKVLSLPMVKKLELSLLQKINAEETRPTTTPDNLDPSEKVIHYGVQCDGCERQVIGFRYKCAFCPNYDLCQNCEARGIHHEHYMVRIPVPVNRDVEFGKKMMKGLFKFNRHSMRADRECRRGGGGHHKHGSPGRHCPFMPPPQPCSSANNGADNTQGESSRSIFDQGLPINVEGIIESVMQGLLRMAGADVPAETNEQEPASSSAEGGGTSSQQQQPQTDNQKTPSTTNIFKQNSTQSTSADQEGAAANVPIVVESPASTSSGAGPSQDMQDQTAGESWTFINKGGLGEIGKQQVESNNGLLNGGGDMQSQQQPINPQQTAGSSQQQQNKQSPLYPNLEKSSSSSSTTNNPATSKIEESLNRMLSMGFNNEGDFLRQILIAKNGSIEQVLDMLLPKRSF